MRVLVEKRERLPADASVTDEIATAVGEGKLVVGKPRGLNGRHCVWSCLPSPAPRTPAIAVEIAPYPKDNVGLLMLERPSYARISLMTLP